MGKKKNDHSGFEAMKKPAGNASFKGASQNIGKKGVLRQKQIGK